MNRRQFFTIATSGIIVPKFEPIFRKLWVPKVQVFYDIVNREYNMGWIVADDSEVNSIFSSEVVKNIAKQLAYQARINTEALAKKMLDDAFAPLAQSVRAPAL